MGHHKKISAKKIWKGFGDGIKSIAHPIEKAVENTVDLPSKALDKVGSISSELALPLVIVGAVVLVAFLNKQ
jgi:hypothetical protein